jgi:glycosyltransferase involved in cell wall biosynthesis
VRILMISDVYFPRVNGVSTSIRVFRDELVRRGHPVGIVAPRYGRESAADERETHVARAAGIRVPFDPEDRVARPARLVSAAEDARRALGGVDLVHVHTPFSAFSAARRVARRWQVPLVATHHTHFEAYGRHYLPWLPAGWLERGARLLVRSQARNVSALIVPSEPLRVLVRSYGVRARVDVVPTGLDLDRFTHADRAEGRRRLGIDPKTPLLVHVGRLAREKDVSRVVRVAARVVRDFDGARAVLAGEGPARAELERQIAGLGLAERVTFLGYLDRQHELPDLYAAGDVFVSASTTETQGLVLLEAMASGLPVVGVSALGTRGLLEAGLGAIVADDDDGLTGGVLSVLRDEDLRERLRREARTVAAGWSVERTTDELLSVYGAATGKAIA